jgi:hypothetical protein
MPATVYVPAPGGRLEKQLEPGSAILGTESHADDAMVAIRIEPRRTSKRLRPTFGDLIELCTRRERWDRTVPTADLVRVGVFDELAGAVRLDSQAAGEQLAAWLAEPALDLLDLGTTGRVLAQLTLPEERPDRTRRGSFHAR